MLQKDKNMLLFVNTKCFLEAHRKLYHIVPANIYSSSESGFAGSASQLVQEGSSGTEMTLKSVAVCFLTIRRC